MTQEPGERRREERRKRDGMGWLPLARSPEERANREQLNKMLGLLLLVLGAAIVGGSASLLADGNWTAVPRVVLGLFALGWGVFLIGRQDRRGEDWGRRKIRHREEE